MERCLPIGSGRATISCATDRERRKPSRRSDRCRTTDLAPAPGGTTTRRLVICEIVISFASRFSRQRKRHDNIIVRPRRDRGSVSVVPTRRNMKAYPRRKSVAMVPLLLIHLVKSSVSQDILNPSLDAWSTDVVWGPHRLQSRTALRRERSDFSCGNKLKLRNKIFSYET